MVSAALKTLLACDAGALSRLLGGRSAALDELAALASACDGECLVVDREGVEVSSNRLDGHGDAGGAEKDPWDDLGGERFVLLFDRPRQAVECAFDFHALCRRLDAGAGTSDDQADGEAAEAAAEPRRLGRAAVHLGEVSIDETARRLEPGVAVFLDRLLGLALDGQTLVSAVVEGLLRHGSASGEVSGADLLAWRWRHHGRYRFSGEDEAIEVIEVGDDSSPLESPRESNRVTRITRDEGPQLQPGDSLLRYRILDVLGRGGMGVVYRAEDGRLRRQVALKTLTGRVAREREHLLRFEREVQAVASVSHPNIVTIHNVEQDGDIRFLTMELVEGQTLQRAIPDDGMPLETLLEVAVPLADALAAAHARGVVHRDLKPSNVMVTREGRVKVLDFGLAKLRDDAETVTDVGQMLGTLAYMAPEQLEGRPVDARADLFAFGVLLYEMATGERPFAGRGASLMYAVLNHQAPPLGSRRPGLPAALGELVTSCLAKRPEERPESAREVHRRLLEVRRAAGLKDTAPLPLPALPALRRGGPLLVAAGVVASLLLVLWLFVTGPDRGPRTAPTTPAEATAAETGTSRMPRLVVLPCSSRGDAEDPYFAQGITAEITNRLGERPELEVISYASSLRYADSPKPLEQIGEELSVTHAVRCSILWHPGRFELLMEIERLSDRELLLSRTFEERALPELFDLQARIAQEVVTQLAASLAMPTLTAERPTANRLAYAAYLRGQFFDNLPDYTPENRRRVIEHFTRATEEDPGFMLAWGELAKAHALFYQLRHDLSDERRRLAREAVERALELDPASPKARLAEGLVHYWTERDYDAALEDLDYARERLSSSWQVYAATAWIQRREGRTESAWRNLERALEINPRDPALATNAGITATWLRRYPEARDLLDLAIVEAPTQPMAFWFHALTYWLWTGRTEEARASLEAMPVADDPRIHWYWFRQLFYERRPREARERLRAMPDPWIQLSDFSCPTALPEAMTWQLEGREEEARDAWRRAAELLRAEREQHRGDPRFQAALGVALAALGERSEALDAARRALDARPLESDAYEGPAYLEHLAWIHVLLGEHAEAIEVLGRLLTIPSRLSPALLRLDPRWDPLRGDPAFEGLLKAE